MGLFDWFKGGMAETIVTGGLVGAGIGNEIDKRNMLKDLVKTQKKSLALKKFKHNVKQLKQHNKAHEEYHKFCTKYLKYGFTNSEDFVLRQMRQTRKIRDNPRLKLLGSKFLGEVERIMGRCIDLHDRGYSTPPYGFFPLSIGGDVCGTPYTLYNSLRETDKKLAIFEEHEGIEVYRTDYNKLFDDFKDVIIKWELKGRKSDKMIERQRIRYVDLDEPPYFKMIDPECMLGSRGLSIHSRYGELSIEDGKHYEEEMNAINDSLMFVRGFDSLGSSMEYIMEMTSAYSEEERLEKNSEVLFG